MKTILVVANETLGGSSLLDAVRARAAEGEVRFVICVPQNRPRSGLVVYDDAVFDAAQVRVDLALEFIRAEHIQAIGEVGDPDPYTATIDAVHAYRPGEIIISTYPETRSGWLRRDLIDRVRDATGLPVEHVIADPDTEGLPFHVTLHPLRPSPDARGSTFIRVSWMAHASMERSPAASSAITVLSTTKARPAARSVSS